MKENNEKLPLNGKKTPQPSEEKDLDSESNNEERLVFKRVQTFVLGFGLFAVVS